MKRLRTIYLSLFVLVMAGTISLALQAGADTGTAAREYLVREVYEFQSQLDTLILRTEAGAGRDELLTRFRGCRLQFKRFEFLLEYLDSRRYQFFNGVNAIETDEGYVDPSFPPEGLQVLEGFLYADSLDREDFVLTIRKLQYKTLVFYYYLSELELKPTFLFEAMRFNLVRLETMTIAGFDSPDLRNSLNEARVNLQTMHSVLGFLSDDPAFLPQAKAIESLRQNVLLADAALAGRDFDSFDRLGFIKAHIQPLAAGLIDLQESAGVPYLEQLHKLFRAVNLKAKTIYDTGFLNSKFYASDKYYADDPRLAELGRKLFFDKRLSADQSMSCATCHSPTKAFTDGLPTSITNVPGEFQERNTPTILNAALQAAYFHDLRAVTLETQIDQVVSNPREFHTNYDVILQRLRTDTQYVRLFAEAFPKYAPDAVSISGINLCIAAFERELVTLNSPFDRYMRGELSSIDPAVKRGFNLFMGKAQCGTCHFAPTYFGTVPPFYGATESEVLGVPKVWDTINPVLDPDIGRLKFLELPDFKHSFKTATVRNAELTAPYMHNGSFARLEDVVEFYDRGGGAGMGLDVPNQTLPDKKLNLSAQDKKDLVAFMHALTDTSFRIRVTP